MRQRTVWGVHDNQGFGTTIPSGCGFYRIVLPFDQLDMHGWKTGCGAAFTADAIPDFEPSIVVGQRFDQPHAVPAWRKLRDICKIVYEIDDDPFSVDRVNWLAYPVYGQEETLATIRECAELAHVVTVSTEPLAEVFRQFNPNVVVLPNYIPAQLLTIQRRQAKSLTLGFAGGVSHMRDLAMIAQTWRDVVDRTCARGHFVGTDYRNMLRPRGFDHTGWIPLVPDYYLAIDFDIGLIPIAPHPFNESKSHIKALEYAALGIPVVASDCAAYRDFVIDGLTGFLVSTQAEWREAIMMLLGNERLREEMGLAARRHAAAYTIEGNYHKWDKLYEGLLEA